MPEPSPQPESDRRITCERCRRLNDLLQKERKAIVDLKSTLEAAREISKGRKKRIDEMMASQIDGTDMAKSVLSRLLTKLQDVAINKDPLYLKELLGNTESRHKLWQDAMRAVDNYQGDDSAHRATAKRKPEEHRMPRHGKYSS